MRNSLNALNANIDMANSMNKDLGLKEYLQNGKVCCETLLQMINNILESVKLAFSEMEIHKKEVKIYDISNRLWIISKQLLQQKGITGYITVNKNVPHMLMLDVNRLTQVLLNLVSNAIKFTEKGGVYVTFEWINQDKITAHCYKPIPYHKDEEGIFEKDGAIGWINEQSIDEIRTQRSLGSRHSSSRYTNEIYDFNEEGILKIIIRDTGCGIAEDNLGLIFQKYNQVCEADKKRLGTGLGLWISKQIIEKMGGEIKVFSQEKVGTTIIVCLKTSVAPICRTISQEAMRELQRSLMVVFSDDIQYLVKAKRLLSKAGFNNTYTVPSMSAYKHCIDTKCSDIRVIFVDIKTASANNQKVLSEIRDYNQLRKLNISIIWIGEPEILEAFRPHLRDQELLITRGFTIDEMKMVLKDVSISRPPQ